ncbi:lycopene cyclase family protein [Flavihumibacter petaseus]|uniref:Putative lycopene cyclase n=1 Tax=Flavihumibacter petaseus NBRC 106054 TaxID=1220578 RepID=A0A0E9N765_9BACT|nr:lycopene cyclase family protein [Flavihumibacter petaseus]GAO45190.1 putative lycopene cyclase [Flavihumibacter petaseus NBRC 106054]
MQHSSLYQYKPYNYSYSYDFVFAGAGVAGLSLLVRMLQSGLFNGFSFLLVDRDRKASDNTHWCFWERGRGYFESLVAHRWQKTWIHGPGYSDCIPIAPYEYKMIRKNDFYRYCLDYIKTRDNVRLLFEPVRSIRQHNNRGVLHLENGERYEAAIKLFQSFQLQPTPADRRILLRHSSGWVIETPSPQFDVSANTMMDLRMPQQDGVNFMCTMPLAENRVFIASNLISGKSPAEKADDERLSGYLRNNLCLSAYHVVDIEKRSTLMNSESRQSTDRNIVHIGGRHSFGLIQEESDAVLRAFLSNEDIGKACSHPHRFRFYDKMMNEALRHKHPSGAAHLTRIFRRNPVQRVFRFLDKQTTLTEDLQMMASLLGLS